MLRLVVACYCEYSRAVDGANQMALQLRIMTRQMTWDTAVRVFMLRYAAANAFAACKALGLVERGTTLWEFQWDIIQRCYFTGPKWCALTMSPQVVHAPVKVGRKQLCSHCRTTRMAHVCKACNVPLHATEDANKTEKADMDWTRQSWRLSLCHPYPWDRCEP